MSKKKEDISLTISRLKKDVAPDEQKKKKDVAPGEPRKKKDVAPDEQKKKKDVAPDEKKDVEPGEPRKKKEVLPDEPRKKKDVLPDEQKKKKDVLPDEPRKKKDVVPEEQKKKKDVVPEEQKKKKDVVPEEQKKKKAVVSDKNVKKDDIPMKKMNEDYHFYKKEDDDSDSSEDSSDYPFLDPSYIEQHTKDYEKLRVYLKKSYKGVSLFAREPIKKGQIVSYYKIKVMSERSKVKRVKDGIYTFNIYSKDDEKLKKYYGDICMESLEKPRRGIPFFGYFANEPSNGQVCNTTVDINLKENYSDRDEVRTGDFMIYRLIALRDISIDDEICWYYGDHYDRDYDISDRTR
jgi:hypothetical protein